MDSFVNWSMGSWFALGSCLLAFALLLLAIGIVISLAMTSAARDATGQDNAPRRLDPRATLTTTT